MSDTVLENHRAMERLFASITGTDWRLSLARARASRNSIRDQIRAKLSSSASSKSSRQPDGAMATTRGADEGFIFTHCGALTSDKSDSVKLQVTLSSDERPAGDSNCGAVHALKGVWREGG